MKKELFTEKDNQLYIKKTFPFLKKKKIRIGRGDERSFLIFPNENTFVNFMKSLKYRLNVFVLLDITAITSCLLNMIMNMIQNKIFRGKLLQGIVVFLVGEYTVLKKRNMLVT